MEYFSCTYPSGVEVAVSSRSGSSSNPSHMSHCARTCVSGRSGTSANSPAAHGGSWAVYRCCPSWCRYSARTSSGSDYPRWVAAKVSSATVAGGRRSMSPGMRDATRLTAACTTAFTSAARWLLGSGVPRPKSIEPPYRRRHGRWARPKRPGASVSLRLPTLAGCREATGPTDRDRCSEHSRGSRRARSADRPVRPSRGTAKAPGRTWWSCRGLSVVGDTGIEPVTSSVSGKRATAAPIAQVPVWTGVRAGPWRVELEVGTGFEPAWTALQAAA